MKTRRLHLALTRTLVLACAALPVCVIAANQARAFLGISVTVLAYTLVQPISQVEQLTVTAADRSRGYVEILGGTLLKLRSNHVPGHYMVLTTNSSAFSHIGVLGVGAAETPLSGTGGRIVLPHVDADTRYVIGYRLYLSDAAALGTTPWPLSVHIEPI